MEVPLRGMVGGCDGPCFPMRLTELQETPFDVRLHVFHRAGTRDLWIFPYDTDSKLVPHDKREGGPAVD